jgi:hypothetical protein
MSIAVSSNRSITLTDLPSWYTNAAESEWINVRAAAGLPENPNQLRYVTSGNFGNVTGTVQSYPTDDHLLTRWTDAITLPDHYAIVAQGGHAASSDNGVYVYGPFSSETPTWVRALDSDFDEPAGFNGGWTVSGRPGSRHGYNAETYIPDLGGGVGHEWFSAQHSGPWETGGNVNVAQSYFFATDPQDAGTYEQEFARTNTDFSFGVNGDQSTFQTRYDSGREMVYCTGFLNQQERLMEYNPRTRIWRQIPFVGGTPTYGSGLGAYGSAIDPIRRVLVVWHSANNGGMTLVDIGTNHEGEWLDVTATGLATNGGDRPGLAYEPVGGKIVSWEGGQRIGVLTIPANFRNGTEDPAEPITVTAGYSWDDAPNVTGITPSVSSTTGTWGKFGYIASVGVLALQAGNQQAGTINGDLVAFKVPAAGL